MPKQKPPGGNRSTDCTKQAENNHMMEEDPLPDNKALGATGDSTSRPPDVPTVMEKDLSLQKNKSNFQMPPSLHSPSSREDIKRENVPKEEATTLLGGPSKDDVGPKTSAQGECIGPKSDDQTLNDKSDPGRHPRADNQQVIVASARIFDSNCPPDRLLPNPGIRDDLPFKGGKRHRDEISPHIPDKPETSGRSSPNENPSRESARCKGMSGVNQALAEIGGHSSGVEQPSPRCLSSSQHTDPPHQAEWTRQTHTLPHRNDGAERGARSPPTDEHAKPEESSTKVADEQTNESQEGAVWHQKEGDSVCSPMPSDVWPNELPASMSGVPPADVEGSSELTAEARNDDSTRETCQDESLESLIDELGLEGQYIHIDCAGGSRTLQVPTTTTSDERSPETRPLQQSSTQTTSMSSPQSDLQSDAQSETSASWSTREQTTSEQTTSQTENNAASEIAPNQSQWTEDSLLSQNRMSQAISQPPSRPVAGQVQASASPPPRSRCQPTPVQRPQEILLQAQSERTLGMSQGTVPRCDHAAVPTRQSPSSQRRPVLVPRPVPQSSQPCGMGVGPRGREAQGSGRCVVHIRRHIGRQRQEDQQGSQNAPSVYVVDLRQQAVDMGEHRDLNVDARDLLTDIDLQQQHELLREITGASHLSLGPGWSYPEMAAVNAEWAGLPSSFQRFLDECLMTRIAAVVLMLTPAGTAGVVCVVCRRREVNVLLFPCHHRPLCRLCLVQHRLCRCPLHHCCQFIAFFFQFGH